MISIGLVKKETKEEITEQAKNKKIYPVAQQ